MGHINKVMYTKEGREFINGLLSFCGVYQASYGETNDILRQEGKREVGLYLLSLIQESDRNLLYKMMEEGYVANKEKRFEDERDIKRERDDHYSGINPSAREYFHDDGDSRGRDLHTTDEGLNL